MRVVTNFKRIPTRWTARNGLPITIKRVGTFGEFLRSLNDCDVIVINGDMRVLSWLCVCFALVPAIRKPIVVVDAVLREPVSRLDRFKCALKRRLFGQVDHFIHYFTDLSGFARWHGIDASRSSHVPFKVNIYNDVTPELQQREGDVVLCAGRSLRDFDTFFAATEGESYTAAIAEPDVTGLGAHGARFTRPLDALPSNLLLLKDRGTSEDWVALLARAKVVVIPTLKSSQCASGISTYLDAMWLGKPVVISAGPGASDLLTDQAVVVAAEDPNALRQGIRTLMEQPEHARQIAQRGLAYARSLGGEPEFLDRILERVAEWYEERTLSKGAIRS